MLVDHNVHAWVQGKIRGPEGSHLSPSFGTWDQILSLFLSQVKKNLACPYCHFLQYSQLKPACPTVSSLWSLAFWNAHQAEKIKYMYRWTTRILCIREIQDSLTTYCPTPRPRSLMRFSTVACSELFEKVYSKMNISRMKAVKMLQTKHKISSKWMQLKRATLKPLLIPGFKFELTWE